MNSKLTELNESSPSALPTSVLCGSGIFSQLVSHSIASSGNFDPSETYDSYKAVEVSDPACTECLARGKYCFQHYNPQYSKCHYCFIGQRPCHRTGVPTSNVRGYLCSGKERPFGKQLPVTGAPTPDATTQYSHCAQRDVARWTNVGAPIPVGGRPIYSSSEVPISRINTQGVVKRMRRIGDSPTDPDVEDSKVKLFLVLPELPNLFLLPFLLPFLLLHQVLAMPGSSRRRDELSPLPFPDAQVFQRKDCWPIQITRGAPNAESQNQEAVARLFRRVIRNSREVIMYVNDRTIPGTASEEMAAKFSWYEDELINDFCRNFDDLGRDN
ncbi:hypothetical protein O181_090972 [Austropuccinia psidii MF-1]|uniref:Uncharacterized protein n=1 Tax=Austropuccinia psidii MF-1 TaxID=1389203 RepID=A0A9Q3P860_9BASI|nr:hypothetical protein [Austropuccinia psidii MF-1]